MKLNEKIYHCRKKAGLSQEALAERIGVSRQAISKWETGEASPEITKLPLLAKTFGVTADWLLAEDDEPAEAPPVQQNGAPQESPGEASRMPQSAPSANQIPEWIDKLPNFLGRLIRQYGWIIGVRIAIAGALFTAIGFVAKAMFSSMNSFANEQMNGVLGGFGGSTPFYNSAGSMINPGSIVLTDSELSAMGLGGAGFGGNALPEPFSILCSFIIVIGLMMLIGGVLLAWYLKKRSSES